MNKKLQIFVSSTFTDLIEERQAAVEAILDAGHIPAGMELFKAGKSQMYTIRKWIDESDVYMLILGGRYGSIEEESGLSYPCIVNYLIPPFIGSIVALKGRQMYSTKMHHYFVSHTRSFQYFLGNRQHN